MANRAKGTGTIIHDRKRNRWIFQFWQTMSDGKKHRRAVAAKTRAALEQRIAKLDITVAPDMTLREWIQKWLAVYVDKMLSKLTQRGKCHWCVVDKCPALASRTYLSSQQTLIGIVVEVVAVEERLDNARLIMTKPEHRLHDAF